MHELSVCLSLLQQVETIARENNALLMADIAVINKVDSAPQEKVDQVRANIRRW